MEKQPDFLKKLLASPYGGARLREYYSDWARVAWTEFRLIERRGGLVLSFLLASTALVADAMIFGSSPQSARALIALLGGLFIATIIVALAALARTPPRIALRKEFEEGETIDSYAEFGSMGPFDNGPPVLRFVTRNKRDRALPVDSAGEVQVSALRFFGSIDRVVRRSDLPIVLKLRRHRGRIIVRDFDGCTVLLGEENTSGVMIHAEVYYASEEKGAATSGAPKAS